MPLFDFFRGFLGFPQQPGNYGHYSNPERNDCEEDDDDDEDAFGNDPFGHFSHSGENPFERHFEDMFRHFEEMFGRVGMAQLPPMPHLPEEFGTIEQPRGSNQRSLRDEALKASERPSLGLEPFSTREGDIDLDERISKEGLDKLLPNEESRVLRPSVSQPQMRFQRVTISKIRKHDGSIEEKKTVTDSEGNETTVVTRSVDDRAHSLTTKRSKEGETESTEEFVNMSEDELSNFNRRWQRGIIQPPPPPADRNDTRLLDSDSQSFFGRLFKDWRQK